MGTFHPQSPTVTVVFSGDASILSQWQRYNSLNDLDFPVSTASLEQVVSDVESADACPATVILSLFDLKAGRIQLPLESVSPEEAAAPVMAALARMARLPRNREHPNIILLTHAGSPLDICCQAVRLGVAHFVDTDAAGWEERLNHAVANAPAIAVSERKADPQSILESVGITAISPAMQELILHVHRGAQVSDATVLIHGESGTGKQLLAEAVHRLDPKRSKGAFIPVNCAAITGTLAESELFGHTKGAFSGATDARLGYFRSANKGTIFLDEISELPLHLQPKLLRVLQERRVLPVGADKEETIDVRVIAASNVSLQEKVAKGEFRLDLYQRLNVIHLAVPPLRKRIEDIPLLVSHFVKKYQHYCSDPIREIDPLVFEMLKSKAGSGNVRELENIVRQTLVFKAAGDRLELSDLPKYMFEAEDAPKQTEMIPSDVANNLVSLIRSRRLTLRQAVEAFEKTLIQQAANNSPSLSKVELAKILGLPRRTLYYKLDNHDSAGE